MVNHKEILRLKNLGLTHREIAEAAGCGRNTVTRILARAQEQKLHWQQAQSMSPQEVTQRLFPGEQKRPVYKMPDYEWVHREMQKSGVTLSLLWVEYCEPVSYTHLITGDLHMESQNASGKDVLTTCRKSPAYA